MPSIFDGFWRMVKGEPMFQVKDESKPPEVDATKPQQTPTPIMPQPVTPPQSRPLPYVAITRWEHEYHGNNLQVNLTFHNTSQEAVELDHVLLFGQESSLEETLEPGARRELKVYYGAPLTSGAYTKAEVWYKDCDRNAYGSLHTVEYHINRQGQYEIARFRFQPPVKKYR